MAIVFPAGSTKMTEFDKRSGLLPCRVGNTDPAMIITHQIIRSRSAD